MKILSLKALNINSLKGTTKIDFAKLTQESALFVITGPTGSGKSTLLDIISCALYGRTARLKNPNNLMSKNSAEAYCEVEFEIKGNVYRSSWRQRRARKKHNGAFQSAIMELVDLQENKILPLKPSEVPKKIEELSGLDFSRFMQSMLLAQGSFASFLKVDEKERSVLLEKITGTQIYAEISKAIFEKYRFLEQKIVDEQKVLDSISLLSEDVIAQKKRDLQENISKKRENEKKLQKVNKALTWSHRLKELQDEHKKYKKSLKQAKSNLALHLQKQEDIQKRVAQRSGYLEAHKKEEQLFYTLEIIKKNIKEYKHVIGKNSLAESQKGRFWSLYTKQKEEITRLHRIFEKKEEVYLKFVESLHNDSEGEESLVQNLDEVQIIIRTLVDYRQLVTQKRTEEDALQKSRELSASWQETLNISKEHREEIKHHIETIRQKQEREQLVVKYEMDRKKLVEGEACFLCGAKEHPFVKEMESICVDKTKEMLQNRIEELQEREKSLQELELRLGVMVAKEEDREVAIKRIEEKIAQHKTVLKKYAFEVSDNAEKTLKEKEEQLRKQLKRIKQNRLTKEMLLQEKEKAFRELQRAEKGDTIQNIVKNLQSSFALFGRALDLENIEEQYEELFTLKERYRESRDALKALEKELSREDIKIGESQTKVNLFTQEKASLQQKIEQLQERIDALHLVKFNKALETLLRQKIDALQERIGSERKELELCHENSNKFQKCKTSLQKKKESFAVWIKLNELVGSADGTKFKKFVQGVTLEQLIHLANRHLEVLSNRYTLARNREKLLELEIIDGYQGNAERPVNTLSGGESFIVSLALALGLSELASQKIAIDSLFLDEGFGTLDSESLEIALNALNLLQTSGKMVGVISHVEVLKERIPLQIEIVPNGDGTSSVKI